MKISYAIALLLAPCVDASSVKQKVAASATFPTLPSGKSVVNVATGVLEHIQKEVLPREMYRKDCWTDNYSNPPREECWEGGL